MSYRLHALSFLSLATKIKRSTNGKRSLPIENGTLRGFNCIKITVLRHNCTEILIQISVQLFYAKRLYSTRFREQSRFQLLCSRSKNSRSDTRKYTKRKRQEKSRIFSLQGRKVSDTPCDFFVKKITIVFRWFEGIKNTSVACIFSKLRRQSLRFNFCSIQECKNNSSITVDRGFFNERSPECCIEEVNCTCYRFNSTVELLQKFSPRLTLHKLFL